MKIPVEKPADDRFLTILYRVAVIFFVIATFIQIPFTYFGFVYFINIKHASIDSICQSERNVKDNFGWSYEGDMENAPQ